MSFLLKQQHPLFDHFQLEFSSVAIETPAAYSGLTAFHKYWGKKPIELIQFLLQHLTQPNDIVVDPFLGGGLVTRCSRELNRRFIGIDVNPVSLELGKFFVSLPRYNEYADAYHEIASSVRPIIEESYGTKQGEVASHYLWECNSLKQVWITGKKNKRELTPTNFDQQQINRFEKYFPKKLRNAVFFDNSRINSLSHFKWSDLFTLRALRNIELLLNSFERYPESLRRALRLTLTSNMGQMSKMVFAISQRGKASGRKHTSRSLEVGSWAIGFWRPPLHFEINVWNCFSLRAERLLKILKRTDDQYVPVEKTVQSFFSKKAPIALIEGSCLDVLPKIPDDSVSLIITDPPHGDRMPYLELSELWNAVLSDQIPNFDTEIVVSNAKERKKNTDSFCKDMETFMNYCFRIMDPNNGFLALMFNAKETKTWDFLLKDSRLAYLGCFPQKYSTGSIVQDNRKGAMREDFVLIFSKTDKPDKKRFAEFPGWDNRLPTEIMEGKQ